MPSLSLSPDPRGEDGVFTVCELAHHYAFPASDGSGLTVGIILLGGGIDPDAPTWATYFRSLGLPRPAIQVVPVGAAVNRPASYSQMEMVLLAMDAATRGPPLVRAEVAAAPPRPGPRHYLRPPHHGHFFDLLETARNVPVALAQTLASVLPLPPPPGPLATGAGPKDIAWTVEGMMDLQLLAGLVPGAAVRVYVSVEGDAGLAAAIQAATADGVAALSCSFSYAEGAGWTQTEAALTAAAAAGVTVCAATGNNGSTWNQESLSVGFPASSPLVLACGGTALVPADEDAAGEGLREVTWNEQLLGSRKASGGGFSARFPQPEWQAGLIPHARRALPDVASNASRESGCWLWIQDPGSPAGEPRGLNSFSMGTSAAAPVMAALITRFDALLGRRLGQVQPLLYKAAGSQRGFRDVVGGTNAVLAGVKLYDARAGWDACSGLGRPIGEELLKVIREALG